MTSTPATEATATTRGVSWSDDEVKTLLAIWGEGKVQEELDGAVRNKKHSLLGLQRGCESWDMRGTGSNAK